MSSNVWQYSRWMWIVSRSLSFNPPTNSERTAVNTFLKSIWDADAETGTRPWLKALYQKKAVSPSDGYKGDVDVEPDQVDSRILQGVARDLKKVPLTDAEATACDAVFTATGNRRLGDKGNIGGAIIS